MGSELVTFTVMVIGSLLAKNKRLQQTAAQGADHPELASAVERMMRAGETDTNIIKYVREQTGLSIVEAKRFVDRIKTKT